MNHSIKIKFQGWVILSILLFGVAVPGIIFSEDIRLSASVDKNQLTLEDSIELSVTIYGARNPSNLELPPLPDFEVRSAGTQSSTQIFNSDMRTSTTQKYLLIPKNLGRFEIGPIILNLSGTVYKSEPIIVSIEKPKSGKANINKNVFIETSVSKINPFVNEQLVYTFKLFRRVEARNLNLNMPYNESLFRKEDIGKAKRYSQIIDGINYDVEEISMALFPLKVGRVMIPASILEIDLIYRTQGKRRNDPFARFFNDPFFGGPTQSTHKVLTTKQIDLNIRRLPEKGKPNGFKNLVGLFAISAELGKTSLELGDTTTLTVTVSGTGNTLDVNLADHDLQGSFKVYPDQPTFEQTIHGNKIGGEKTFKFALVPYAAGNKTIPPISLSYFDPEKSKYITVSTSPIHLTVKQGTKDDRLNLVQPKSLPSQQNGSSVSILARDILPIHTQLKDFENITFNNTDRATYAIGIVTPILIYIFAAGYIRYNQRIKNDTSYSRRQGAYNIAKKKLNQLSSSNTEPKDFVRELSQIIREYIGNKLNLQGTAFTPVEVEKKLTENYFEHEKIIAVRKLLEKCESMQYTSVAITKNSQLIDESADLLKKLEKQA